MDTDPNNPLLNASFDDVISLLEQELERLKVSLETFRLLDKDGSHERDIRYHIREIERREDRLKELLAMKPSSSGPSQEKH